MNDPQTADIMAALEGAPVSMARDATGGSRSWLCTGPPSDGALVAGDGEAITRHESVNSFDGPVF